MSKLLNIGTDFLGDLCQSNGRITLSTALNNTKERGNYRVNALLFSDVWKKQAIKTTKGLRGEHEV